MTRIELLVVAALAPAVWAQGTRTLTLTYITEPQAISEAATVIRSTSWIRDVKVDVASRTIMLSGQPWQLDLAAWMQAQLDRATGESRPATGRYSLPPGQEHPVVAVMFPAGVSTEDQLRNLSTTVRSTLELQQAFIFAASRAMIVRADMDDVTAAEWLMARLAENAAPGESATYGMIEGDSLRVWRPLRNPTSAEVQREVARVRAEAQVRRMMPYPLTGAIAFRGTPEEAARVEHMLRERRILPPA